jgi:hypothetical protein
MSVIEIITFLLSSGVASGGIGALKWAIGIEKRMALIEVQHEAKKI